MPWYIEQHVYPDLRYVARYRAPFPFINDKRNFYVSGGTVFIYRLNMGRRGATPDAEIAAETHAALFGIEGRSGNAIIGRRRPSMPFRGQRSRVDRSRTRVSPRAAGTQKGKPRGNYSVRDRKVRRANFPSLPNQRARGEL